MHEPPLDSAIYDKLKKGPVFKQTIDNTLSCKDLVDEIQRLIEPTETSRPYAVIIGKHD
jgi:hypothetical protein